MGRPLKKDINGSKVIGPVTLESGTYVEGYFDGALQADYHLVKQRGAKTYVVSRDGVVRDIGVLVEGEPAAEGEIRILGSLDGTYPGTVAISKLTKRIAHDFDGNRYTWLLSQNGDSTGNVIVITPVA